MPPPAEARDIPQLVALRRDFTYEDDEGDERDEYEADLRAFVDAAIPGDNWRIWVADNNGRVVSHLYTALIAKVPRPTRSNRQIGYLTNVYTVPEQRRRGIGSKLTAAAQAQAAEEHVELLMVWPRDESIGFGRRKRSRGRSNRGMAKTRPCLHT